ncbi:helix-turn-helix domain-containing protein [Subtercola frigoramans]|uniref:DNA-binding transcriptional regulator YiaG n=1 Tax=Subtercola frigoramans TaxID=120298 RepID=A0ABS2L8P7_9MICO|nr:helix-turn-helix transcriptional regulator [Subtercola frigoramans]MBM7473394.1 DNA-binding transcriptional regulator YiaG [Subtercola frigoramans]
MTLRFRNIDVTPDDPVELWGVEGLLAAIDRGDMRDWGRIRSALDRDPWGAVATELEVALTLAEDHGAKGIMRSHLTRARWTPAQRVAHTLGQRIRESGLTRAEFAEALGTSRSRLSTYENAIVAPSAVFMERANVLARRPRSFVLPSSAMQQESGSS